MNARASVSPSNAVVIVYVQYPNNATSIGTGVFVDHDGLVLTADHVVHRSDISPPVTSTTTNIPEQTTPTKITIYSAFLRAILPVDLTKPEFVVSGVLSSTQWIDVALLRVTLTPEQRNLIQPLHLSAQGPQQNDAVTAWGPKCTDASNERCLTPFPVDTNVSSDPTISRDYEVRDNVTLGYSGGPLTNRSGDIVGIASWGDNGVGEQIVRTSYISSIYVQRFFALKAPPSDWLNPIAGCKNTSALTYLTVFDLNEILPTTAQGAPTDDQCSCCCNSLDRAPYAAYVPASMNLCQKPPFCAEQKYYAALNAVNLAISTKTIDHNAVTNYLTMRAAFELIDMSKETAVKQTQLYDSFASAGAALSSTTIAGSPPSILPSLSLAGSDALIAYKKSLQVSERPEVYFKMGALLREKGDVVPSTAANILGTLTSAPVDQRKQLQVNEKVLKSKLLGNIPSDLPSAPIQ